MEASKDMLHIHPDAAHTRTDALKNYIPSVS